MLPIAMCQLARLKLIHRHREQAPSHIGFALIQCYCEVFAICLSDVRQIKRVVSYPCCRALLSRSSRVSALTVGVRDKIHM